MINKKKLGKFIVNERISFGKAIAKYDKAGKSFLAIVNDNSVLKGIITEGDLRKAILKGVSREKKVSSVMNTQPFVMNKRLADSEMINIMNMTYYYTIRQIPIVDSLNRLQDVVFKNEITRETKLKNRAIIMAGGEGTRLRPLTNDIPKPLLDIGGRPLLETIIGQLKDSGIDKIHISVGYLAKKIKSHFGNGANFGVSIEYIEEKTKLGTVGSIVMIKDRLEAPFIILNGDIMTTLNFKALLEYHEREQNNLTVVLREYNFTVPFGVAKISTDYLIDRIEEKPTENYFINSGVYVLDPDILSLIDSVRYFDMPDLINHATKAKYKVGGFPIREYWVDIGNKADLQIAKEDYMKVFCKNRSVSHPTIFSQINPKLKSQYELR